MNKQRLLIIIIFLVTFVIAAVGIFFAFKYLNTSTTSSTNTQAAVPVLTSASLVCTSNTSNKSLTVTWTAPTNLPNGYMVAGQISDISFPANNTIIPQDPSLGSYSWDQANEADTYQASLWIQDSKGTKGAQLSTNQINSSQCTSGTQPILSTVPSTTSSTSTTSTITTTPSKLTSTITSTPTTTITLTTSPSVTITDSTTITPTSTTLPDTGNELPVILTLLLGGISLILGGILFFRESKIN